MSKLCAFEKNIISLSETDDISNIYDEWQYIQYEKKPKGEKSVCICNRAIQNVSYFYNIKTGHTIAAGTTCANNIKDLIKNKKSTRDSTSNLTHLEPGIYVEILDLDKYSAEIRKELCALLHVEISQSNEETLRGFLDNPISLLNDNILIIYATERLEQFIKQRKEAEEEFIKQRKEAKERAKRESEAELLELMLREKAREARFKKLRLHEKEDEINEMKIRWSSEDRVIKTIDEYKIAERAQAEYLRLEKQQIKEKEEQEYKEKLARAKEAQQRREDNAKNAIKYTQSAKLLQQMKKQYRNNT